MGLGLDFEVGQSKDRLSLNFFNTTLSYDPQLNPGGYGGGVNPDITNTGLTSSLASQIEVLIPGATTPIIYVTTGQFPTLDPDAAFQITGTSLGYATGAKIPNVILNFTFRQTGIYNGDIFNASTSYDILIKGQAQDMVDNLLDSIDATDADSVDNFAGLESVLCAAVNAAKCSKTNKATALLTYVTTNSALTGVCKTC